MVAVTGNARSRLANETLLTAQSRPLVNLQRNGNGRGLRQIETIGECLCLCIIDTGVLSANEINRFARTAENTYCTDTM